MRYYILNEKLTYSMYSPAVPLEVFSGNILFALPACFFEFAKGRLIIYGLGGREITEIAITVANHLICAKYFLRVLFSPKESKIIDVQKKFRPPLNDAAKFFRPPLRDVAKNFRPP